MDLAAGRIFVDLDIKNRADLPGVARLAAEMGAAAHVDIKTQVGTAVEARALTDLAETHGVLARRSGRRLSPALPFVPWLPAPLSRRLFRSWARNYWPRELRRLVGEAGFRIERRFFVWQTFENISGRQPVWLRPLAPGLRTLGSLLERLPGIALADGAIGEIQRSLKDTRGESELESLRTDSLQHLLGFIQITALGQQPTKLQFGEGCHERFVARPEDP